MTIQQEADAELTPLAEGLDLEDSDDFAEFRTRIHDHFRYSTVSYMNGLLIQRRRYSYDAVHQLALEFKVRRMREAEND